MRHSPVNDPLFPRLKIATHVIAPRGNLFGVWLQPGPVRQRIDTKRRMPDQEPRDQSSPDVPAHGVAPAVLCDERGEDQAGKDGDRDKVLVLEPHNCEGSDGMMTAMRTIRERGLASCD